MEFVKEYVCTICNETFHKHVDFMTCPHCGELGILEIVYDYERMKNVITHSYFQHNTDYTIPNI